MKKCIVLLTLLFAVCLLAACGQEGSDTAVTVVVEAGEHYSLEVGAVTLEPGEDAVFYIRTEENYMVTAADYRGEYSLTETRGLTKLVLRDLRYPTRVRLTVSHDGRTIRYLANGGSALTGEGRDITRSYDVRVHLRPNVSIGTDLFEREGYTLTSWNTEPDGSGQRVGLGSRMTVEDSATLYAQWAAWTTAEQFDYRLEGGNAVVTGCREEG